MGRRPLPDLLEFLMFGIDDMLLGGIASGLGSVATGLFNTESTKATNEANAQQAQLNRDFQERMSNTAYQRGMADMKAAGLNPILAYQKGGASSPSGAQATMTAPRIEGNPIGEAVNSGLSMSLRRQELDNMKATNANILADTEKKFSESARTQAELAIRKEELSPAQLKAVQANLDRSVYSSSAGQIARKAGTMAEELNRTVEPIVSNATGFVRGLTGVQKLRPERSTREVSTVKSKEGSSTFEERFKGGW